MRTEFHSIGPMPMPIIRALPDASSGMGVQVNWSRPLWAGNDWRRDEDLLEAMVRGDDSRQ